MISCGGRANTSDGCLVSEREALSREAQNVQFNCLEIIVSINWIAFGTQIC
jgi:hypothetical protein